jgi:hypothetical protein
MRQLEIDFTRLTNLGNLTEVIANLAGLLGKREIAFVIALVQVADRLSDGNDLIHCQASLNQIAKKMGVARNTALAAKNVLLMSTLLAEEERPGAPSVYLLDAKRIFSLPKVTDTAPAEPVNDPSSNPFKVFCTPSKFSVPRQVEAIQNPFNFEGVLKGCKSPSEKIFEQKQAEKHNSENFEGVQGTENAKHVLKKHVLKKHVVKEHVLNGEDTERKTTTRPPSRTPMIRIRDILRTDADLIDPRQLQQVFEAIAKNHAADPEHWRAPSQQLRLWIFASGKCVHDFRKAESRLAVFKAGLRPAGSILPRQADEDWARHVIHELDHGPPLPRSGPIDAECDEESRSRQRSALAAMLAGRER